MGLRLDVQRRAWLDHVAAVTAAHPGLTPVVKGNGYGFGRNVLARVAADLVAPGGHIAVGTVYEAGDVPSGHTAWVLTPHVDRLPSDLPPQSVLTIGHVAHVEALRRQGWVGEVMVKLASSMRRYGTTPDDLAELLAAADGAALAVSGCALHLPLAGDDDARLAEITAWTEHLEPHVPLSVSHLGADAYRRLRETHPQRSWSIRLGTALWHGDKQLVHLSADVLDVRPVTAGATAGYRAADVAADGHLVLIAAGSAHGMRALDDGRSPFHFERTRLALVEPPHMHTSMVLVPTGGPLPSIGDRVDVQRPLITTAVDELVWLDD
ncbi:MAG: hypothetical protein JWM34_1810 [Ilumatobacteraceae bacterium]|nr:hypothetical protein [Ilumatobacteraceae bacterium]